MNNTNAQLTTHELQLVQNEVNAHRKSAPVAWLLWLFTGVLGGHRFYMGNTTYAVLMLIFGWATAGIWPLIDGFFIPKRLRELEKEAEEQAIMKVKALTR